MKALLYYSPDTDSMAAQYVSLLCEAMRQEVTCDVATDVGEVLKMLEHQHYDLLHMHGCWHRGLRCLLSQMQRRGVRLVFTPHGQLQPWVIRQHYWQEKLPRLMHVQREIARQSYAVVVQGNMEQECLERLGWNHRLVIIRNPLITHSITPGQMGKATVELYRRVMDTNPLALLSLEARMMLFFALKAGITGDRSWVADHPVHGADYAHFSPQLPTEQWRLLLVYARLEEISDVVERGLHLLGVDVPDISLDLSRPFLPDGHEPVQSIDSAIGQQFATENDRLLATFRYVRRLMFGRRLALAHLVELDHELRQHPCMESQLADDLRERHLYATARRTMQLMADMTGFDEGYMPVPCLSDGITRRLRHQIEHRFDLSYSLK